MDAGAAMKLGIVLATAVDLPHAVAVALDLRRGVRTNDLLDRLAADPRLGLTRKQLDATQADPLDLTGAARDQVDDVADKVKRIAKKYPDAAAYTPGSVL